VTLLLEKGALRFQFAPMQWSGFFISPEHEFPRVAEYVVISPNGQQASFSVAESPDDITLTTSKLKVVVAKKTARSFSTTPPEKS